MIFLAATTGYIIWVVGLPLGKIDVVMANNQYVGYESNLEFLGVPDWLVPLCIGLPIYC
jgi:hypothetical protein